MDVGVPLRKSINIRLQIQKNQKLTNPTYDQKNSFTHPTRTKQISFPTLLSFLSIRFKLEKLRISCRKAFFCLLSVCFFHPLFLSRILYPSPFLFFLFIIIITRCFVLLFCSTILIWKWFRFLVATWICVCLEMIRIFFCGGGCDEELV